MLLVWLLKMPLKAPNCHPPAPLHYLCCFIIQVTQALRSKCGISWSKRCADILLLSFRLTLILYYFSLIAVDSFSVRLFTRFINGRRIKQGHAWIIRVGCPLCDITGDICSLNSSAPSRNCFCSLAILRQTSTETVDWYWRLVDATGSGLNSLL